MGPWLLLTFLVAVCVAAAVLAWALTRRIGVRRRVVVNLLDGKAVAGVLWARRGQLVILKDATLHESGADPVPVDGEVLVERARIDFVQVL